MNDHVVLKIEIKGDTEDKQHTKRKEEIIQKQTILHEEIFQ